MTRLRSGPLAAWVCAWLAGSAAADEVVRASTGSDAPHRVSGLDDDPAGTPLSELLIRWRQAGGLVQLVLPIAGDIRGVPGPAAFRSAALEAGEAVYGGGIGAVPEVFDPSPSSAPVSVLWRTFAVEPAIADYQSVADAQHDLVTAVRDAATALKDSNAAGAWGAGPADVVAGLQGARRAGERVNLPPGHPPPAVALVAQAERLHAVLDLAGREDGIAGEPAHQCRAAVLRELSTAVRRARLAGYNAWSL